MRYKVLTRAAIMLAVLTVSLGLTAQTYSQAPQSPTSANQQAQLDRLKQLEGQLQGDRDAVHEAIGRYGFESDQAAAARTQLVRDRTEYRQLRRGLVAAGVVVPRAGKWTGFRGRRAHQGRLGPKRGWMGRGAGMRPCPCRGL
jgi:hypothetical protein